MLDHCNDAPDTANDSTPGRENTPAAETKRPISQIPLFEEHALATMDRCKATFAGRGTEYGDTWRECEFLTMKAVARKLGCQIDPDHFRALATAAFVDMKHERNRGGWKDDTAVDGINYLAFLAEDMRRLRPGS